MVWQVVRRSIVSLCIVASILGCCALVASAVPDGAARIIGPLAASVAFGAVIILVGWIFQERKPTDPPPRRLSAVVGTDEPAWHPAAATAELRRAA